MVGGYPNFGERTLLCEDEVGEHHLGDGLRKMREEKKVDTSDGGLSAQVSVLRWVVVSSLRMMSKMDEDGLTHHSRRVGFPFQPT